MTRGIAATLATVSVLALAGPAFAQEAVPSDEARRQVEQPGATATNTTVATADPAGVGTDDDQSGDIIVTATRRAQRLQDVPLAVNALSGDQLVRNGFNSVQDIQYQLPGVQFGTSTNDAGFRLRGVGSAGGFTSSSEQNVGTVVDNVVVPFGNPVQSLGDLDRIEVLKGPQGTQFGKNASSGVVNITTRKPDFDRFGGNAFASYGELNERNLNLNLNVPLGQTLALAVYGFDREYDGFVRNIVRNEDWGGVHAYGGRAKLLWEPNGDFSAYLIGDWSRSDQRGPQQIWTLNRAAGGSPINAARFAQVNALGVTPSFDNDVSVEDGPGNYNEENWGGSLELNGRLGEYNITSVTAYRRLDVKPFVYSIDALPLPIFTARESGNDRDFVSQEVRLTSPTGATLEYVAGVYLSRLRAGIDDYFVSAQLRPAQPFAAQPQLSITNGLSTASTTTDSAAAFVDGSIRLAPTFRILVGGRYSYDWVRAESFSRSDPLFPPGTVGPNGFTVPYTPRARATGEVERGDWSGRLGFEATPADDILFFGTVARGYLGPTVTFSGLTGQRVEVDPQTVWDVTVGAKTQFFDRRLTLNGNIFYDSYKDLQTSVFNGLEFLTENAGGFEAAGFEVEGIVRLSRRFSANASYTYSHTYFTDYVTACPDSTVAAGAAAVAAQCNLPGPSFQARGLPLSGAPKHSVTAGINFDQPINDRLSLDATATYYYRSAVVYDPGEAFARQPGYDLVGLNIGIGAPDGAWRIGAFARNLFDTRFHSAVIGLPFSAPGGAVNWQTRDGRRTIGGQVSFRF